MVCVKKKWPRLIYIGVLSILLMTGCKQTQLVRTWQEPTFNDKPLGEILILGVFENDVNRRFYEDGLIKALTKINHSAVTSYSIAPNPLDIDEKEEIRALVKKSKADAVIIATLGSIEKEEDEVRGSKVYEPMMGYGHGMYDYYHFSYQATSYPDRTVTNTFINLEITVFSVKTEQMIWAGATRSINPKSKTKLVNEAANLIIKDMKKVGLL